MRPKLLLGWKVLMKQHLRDLLCCIPLCGSPALLISQRNELLVGLKVGLPTEAGSQPEGMHLCTRTSVSRMARMFTRVDQLRLRLLMVVCHLTTKGSCAIPGRTTQDSVVAVQSSMSLLECSCRNSSKNSSFELELTPDASLTRRGALMADPKKLSNSRITLHSHVSGKALCQGREAHYACQVTFGEKPSLKITWRA